jgi:peptidyl-prolyl cis-trans isomerase SurA
MVSHRPWLVFALLCPLSLGNMSLAFSEPKTTIETPAREILIDSVIASVDDKPITLSELGGRLVPPRKLSLPDAAKDQTVLMALDALIMEKLVEAEAAQKRLSTSDAEVTDYIQEIARRNGLTQASFEDALKNQGQSVDEYKQQVKVDILKTKLASTIARGGTSISESEIDDYLKGHSELSSNTASLKLRHILVSREQRSEDAAKSRVAEIQSALESGESFSDVATRLSDGPHSSDGGLIGTLAEKDLSGDVLGAVQNLKAGSYSSAIEGPQGTQFFFVEERFQSTSDDSESDSSTSEARREEARRALQQQKTQSRLSSYFVGELYKNHAVEKKL